MVEWSNTTDLKSETPDLISVPERGPGSNPGATDSLLLRIGTTTVLPPLSLHASSKLDCEVLRAQERLRVSGTARMQDVCMQGTYAERGSTVLR